MTVKGTCRILEKEYLRLTSPPKAELVRPQSILEQHLSNLKSSYYGTSPTTSSSTAHHHPPHTHSQQQERKVHNGKSRDYHWYCSQFKAIRQDLTVQRIQNAFAVDVYETHAKIALEEEDMNEYNQSQTQLKELYDLISRRRQRNRSGIDGDGDGGSGKERKKSPKKKKHHGNVALLKQKKKSKSSDDGEKNDDDNGNDDYDDDADALKNQNEFIAYRIIYYVFLSQNKKYEGGSSDIFKVCVRVCIANATLSSSSSFSNSLPLSICVLALRASLCKINARLCSS
jgi:hypothetical protein